MDNNREIFINMFNEHKGEFVIDGNKRVNRFVGLIDDYHNYYYVIYTGRKFELQTCVGSLVFLKNKIDDKDYNEFIRLAKLNHYDQPTFHCIKPTDEKYQEVLQFNIQHKKELIDELLQDNGIYTNKLMVNEICWDLN